MLEQSQVSYTRDDVTYCGCGDVAYKMGRCRACHDMVREPMRIERLYKERPPKSESGKQRRAADRKRRARYREQGLCTNCGSPASTKSMCADCAEKHREAGRSLREWRADRGRCIECGKRTPHSRCQRCRKRNRDRMREFRARQKEGR